MSFYWNEIRLSVFEVICINLLHITIGGKRYIVRYDQTFWLVTIVFLLTTDMVILFGVCN